MSLAESILTAPDRPRIPVKPWGFTLYLTAISGVDRDAYDSARWSEKDKRTNWRAKYLVKCLVDADGLRIFTDDQAEALGQKNGEILKSLWEKAVELNGDGVNAVELAAKNSSSDTSSTTGIVSPADSTAQYVKPSGD